MHGVQNQNYISFLKYRIQKCAGNFIIFMYIGSTYLNPLFKDKIKNVIINFNFIYCMEFWHFWSMSIMLLFGVKLLNSKIDDLDIKSAFKVKELDSFTLTIA